MNKRWHAAYVTYAGNPPVPVANVVEVRPCTEGTPCTYSIKCAGPGRKPTMLETTFVGTLDAALRDAEASLRDLGWKETE